MGGDTYERELVNTFDQLNLPAMRAPSSGAATTRELPDVIVFKPYTVRDISETIAKLLPSIANKSAPTTIAQHIGPLTKAYGIEIKSGESTTLYVKEKEVNDLERFCELAGVEPRIGARYTKRGQPVNHYLVPPENARKTEDGNYGLPVKDIETRATEIITPETTTKDPKLNTEL